MRREVRGAGVNFDRGGGEGQSPSPPARGGSPVRRPVSHLQDPPASLPLPHDPMRPAFAPIFRFGPVLAALALVGGCVGSGPRTEPPPPPVTEMVPDVGTAPDPAAARGADAPPPAEAPVPRSPDAASEGWAEATLAGMTLRQKVGQMIMPFVLGDYAPEGSPGHDRIVRMLEEQEIGGLIVSVGSPTDVALKLNDFQRHSRLPLLVGADMESGAGFRLRGAVHLPGTVPLGGATEFPPPMAVGATGSADLAYEMGRITALEARAVGVHVPFAPVLDVNSNPDNPIINTRSFGEEPSEVARLGAAFIRGVQDHGAIATAKHFPGHGDTETDSHLALPVIRSPRERLDSVELVPFRAAVESGVGAIMTAHIAVPSLSGDEEMPSTLAEGVLTDLLRRDLGFEGLLFTDAMDMAAIDARYPRGEASVRAVIAGADVVLMPPSVPEAADALVEAVRQGRIPEARIDRSALAVLRVKERMGLHRQRTVDLERVGRVVGVPSHEAVADDVAKRSVTLLRNRGDLLPLLGTRTARVLSVSLRRNSDLMAGRTFDGVLRNRYPRLVTATLTRDTRPEIYRALALDARRSDLVVVSLYVNWTQAASDEPLPEGITEFIAELERSGTPHVVVSFGNPYLLREVPSSRAYLLAWSGAEASQRAAALALFEGRLTGRMPIQLPSWFSIGDGLVAAPLAGDGR